MPSKIFLCDSQIRRLNKNIMYRNYQPKSLIPYISTLRTDLSRQKIPRALQLVCPTVRGIASHFINTFPNVFCIVLSLQKSVLLFIRKILLKIKFKNVVLINLILRPYTVSEFPDLCYQLLLVHVVFAPSVTYSYSYRLTFLVDVLVSLHKATHS